MSPELIGQIILAALNLWGKAIDGQTAEQKAIMWQQWVDFTEPFHQLLIKNKKVDP